MVKEYNFMPNDNDYICSFGVVIRPEYGTVSTVWKVPVKYQDIAQAYVYSHYSRADSPEIDYVTKGDRIVVTFIDYIDYSGIFDDLPDDKTEALAAVIKARDIAINAACRTLLQKKLNFQDLIRSKFYMDRFMNGSCAV